MPHIRLAEPDEATGALAREYEAAVKRAGKVFNVVKAMSPNPLVLNRSMELYKAVMYGPSELSRVERELLAVVVSRANDCHYGIVAHANDLRAEGAADEIVEAAKVDYRTAPLEPRVRALCDYAVKLTREPAAVGAEEAQTLRGHGWSDRAIHDTVQVVSYFNYINRVADAVGIEDEPEWSVRGGRGHRKLMDIPEPLERPGVEHKAFVLVHVDEHVDRVANLLDTTAHQSQGSTAMANLPRRWLLTCPNGWERALPFRCHARQRVYLRDDESPGLAGLSVDGRYWARTSDPQLVE